MDKFSRRPKAKDRRRRLALYVIAFVVPASCFAVLFGFGNAGANWVIGFYVTCLIVGVVGSVIAARRRLRLWLSNLGFQPGPRVGFTALEVAAIHDLIDHAGTEAVALRQHFQSSEVVARYNAGSGCVVSLKSDAPQTVSAPLLDHVSWYRLEGLSGLVGCRFWARNGVIDLMEMFCGGEDTKWFDWMSVVFTPEAGDRDRPKIPETRPIVTEPHWVRFRMDA